MLTLFAALIPLAAAQDCNAYTLLGDLKGATPQGVAAAFEALADCDAAQAKAAAPGAFDKVLSGEGGNQLAVKAIQVGADDATRAWIDSLQSDERSKTIAAVGDACAEDEAVQRFLVSTHDKLGEKFWTDRWYRSLDNCRVEGIQSILQQAIDADSKDRTRFFAVLEVYSRNLGGAAVPTLEALAGELESEEELIYVVNAFADAAQVGALEGADPEATAAAIAAIRKLAPDLPDKALDQARNILLSLGDEGASNSMAGYRYADEKGADGNLRYGLVVVETATCKKGDTWLGLYSGEVVEGGNLWPDQIQAAAEGVVEEQWEVALASSKKCKGSGEVAVRVTEGPMDSAQIEGWINEQLEELRGQEAKKVVEESRDPLKL
jgi:hypothetical protein